MNKPDPKSNTSESQPAALAQQPTKPPEATQVQPHRELHQSDQALDAWGVPPAPQGTGSTFSSGSLVLVGLAGCPVRRKE
ncbi:MAG: hypothetical protein IPK53_08360 [bacterium]|nr:hypothetical protein [bacterium]